MNYSDFLYLAENGYVVEEIEKLYPLFPILLAKDKKQPSDDTIRRASKGEQNEKHEANMQNQKNNNSAIENKTIFYIVIQTLRQEISSASKYAKVNMHQTIIMTSLATQ